MSLEPAPPAVGSGHANEVMLKHLGEVTIDASRLEHLAVDIAHSLKLNAEIIGDYTLALPILVAAVLEGTK